MAPFLPFLLLGLLQSLSGVLAIRGVPGVDYPIYKTIFTTSFICPDQPGVKYYSDVEAKCQMFHMCHETGYESFLCSTGSLFNEKTGTCDFWYNVKCGGSRPKPTKATSSVVSVRRPTSRRRPNNPSRYSPVQNIHVNVNAQPRVRTNTYIVSNDGTLNTRNAGTKSRTSVSTSFPILSKQSSTPKEETKIVDVEVKSYAEPSYVDDDLIETEIRRAEEFEKNGKLSSVPLDEGYFPPESPVKSSRHGDGEESADDVLSHLVSQFKPEPTRRSYQRSSTLIPPSNGSLFFKFLKPMILSVVYGDRKTFWDAKKALLSAAFESRPIVEELLELKAPSRSKRSMEDEVESSTKSSEPESPIQPLYKSILSTFYQSILADKNGLVAALDDILLLAIEFTNRILRIALFESDQGFHVDTTDAPKTSSELEGEKRIRRSLDGDRSISISRDAVGETIRGFSENTRPLFKEALTSILPIVLKTASENVPQILSFIHSVKPIAKEQFKPLRNQGIDLLLKYGSMSKNSNATHYNLGSFNEMAQDFLPFILSGIETVTQYAKSNPSSLYNTFLGENGILTKVMEVPEVAAVPATPESRIQSSPNRFQTRRSSYRRVRY